MYKLWELGLKSHLFDDRLPFIINVLEKALYNLVVITACFLNGSK